LTTFNYVLIDVVGFVEVGKYCKQCKKYYKTFPYLGVTSNADRQTMQLIKDINKGDLLTFIGVGNKYKGLLYTSTYKDKSPFTFAALTYDNIKKPTTNDLLDCDFFGTANIKNDYFKYSDSELEKMWINHPVTKPYYLGSYGLIIWRKDFQKFRDNFT
jgi:hypothetical protein